MTLENIDHEHVAAIYDTIFQVPSFMRLISDKKISSTIQILLGLEKESVLYGFTNRCRIDPPRDDRRTYRWHQETFYTIPHGKFIQTWAPLVYDTTVTNGTIEVCVGSHKKGVLDQSWNEKPGRATQIIVTDAETSKYKQVQLEMKVGELSFFSGHLVHRSGSNTSNQVRFSLVGMYHDVGAEKFYTPKLVFNFMKKDPKEFYNETFSR